MRSSSKARGDVWCAVACALVATSLPAQSELSGTHRLTPGLLHPELLEILPQRPRPLDGRFLDLHESVPMRVEFVPGKRSDSFTVVGAPGKFNKKLVVPGILNLPLRYDKKRRRTHRFQVTQHGLETLVTSHSGALGRVGSWDLAMIDSDHDGAFGGTGDMWAVKPKKRRRWNAARLHPMQEPWRAEAQTLWLRAAPDGFTLEIGTEAPDFAAMRLADYERGLAHLNGLRAKLGFAPIVLDPKLSEGCENHAEYCVAIDDLTHDEDPGESAYTESGAVAGKCSELTKARSMRTAVQSWLDTFYHRIRMLSPRLERVGMGLIDGIAVMDTDSGMNGATFEPYAWPPDGQVGVPLSWSSGEWPSPTGVEPFDGRTAASYGYPISLTFPTMRVTDVEARLLVDGEELEVFASTPARPGNPKAMPRNKTSILIMTNAPLRSGKTYRVEVRCVYEAEAYERTWKFTTR